MNDRTVQLSLDDAVPSQPMLAPDPLVVRLLKVFSWQQSPSRWPYYLARAEPERAYTREEIATLIFGDERAQEIEGKGWLTSIYAFRVDREHQEVVIEGVGLFEAVDAPDGDRYRISDDGQLLAHAYSADRASDQWKRVFAGILARNDVRVRCVLLHLARWQCLLMFRDGTSASAFFLPGKGGAFKLPDGTEHPLFDLTAGRPAVSSFTPLLRRDPLATLGPFLRARIERAGVRVPENIEFQGGRDVFKFFQDPSANHLRGYMKQAMSLFRDIGALVYVPHRQGWTLDRERCAAVLDPDVVADLFGGAPESRFLEALEATYRRYSDVEGLVRVADIREAVCDELDIPIGERTAYFNRQVAHYLRPDIAKLSIGRTFHSQAGPADCLFGDLGMEYVQFIFAPA